MKVIGVIPARFASTRFPGKPLALIAGKPMIQWVIQAARKCPDLNDIIVATDNESIGQACKAVDCSYVMTDSNLPSGTDRIFAAIQNSDADVIVNIQGDEPLLKAGDMSSLIRAFDSRPELDMATLAHPLTDESELLSLNAVKVICNSRSEAIYFSRFPIPYSRTSYVSGSELALKHIGMYAYRKKFLEKFCRTPSGKLEQAESLEQLRALEMGAKIHVVKVKESSIGVDTPEDLIRAEKLILEGGL